MKITVFGTPACAVCKQVTEFLTNLAIDHDYLTIGKDTTVELVEAVVEHPVRSVPIILINAQEVSFEELRRTVNDIIAIDDISLSDMSL